MKLAEIEPEPSPLALDTRPISDARILEHIHNGDYESLANYAKTLWLPAFIVDNEYRPDEPQDTLSYRNIYDGETQYILGWVACNGLGSKELSTSLGENGRTGCGLPDSLVLRAISGSAMVYRTPKDEHKPRKTKISAQPKNRFEKNRIPLNKGSEVRFSKMKKGQQLWFVGEYTGTDEVIID